MCGIAGIIDFHNRGSLHERICRMNSRVLHRGPDGEGHYIDGAVGLGHRRLAIIELSDLGAQPMRSGSGRAVLTFNGEIYNFVELRSELEALGHKFVSGSDSEVLLQAYERWGERCVSRLNGMWAFAIHDRAERKVFCSRDRFGEKPFYYAKTTGGFVFGSELRQILPELERVAANKNLLERFLLGVTGGDLEDSFFAGVHQLPGGHNAVFDLISGSMQISSYYELKRNPDHARLSLEESREVLGALLNDSVRMRMRSDVRVGTCLSGGVDSSAIAALASDLHGKNAQTPFIAITACSTEAANDESHYAKRVVDHCGLDWITITPDYDDFSRVLNEVVIAQEVPFGSASVVMQFFVMKYAASHGVKVLLDGQGGDEVFLGYERYMVSYLRDILRVYGPVRAWTEARSLMRNNAAITPTVLAKFGLYFHSATLRRIRVRKRGGYLREMPLALGEIDSYAKATRTLFDLQKHEVETANLPTLLRFEDKNSMWHSVETRLPILDHRLVELGCSMNPSHKVHNGWSKFILRDAVGDKLPESITWRKNKLGFVAPQASWVNAHRAEMTRTITSCDLLGELVDMTALGDLGTSMDAASFWRLFATAKWIENFGVVDLE